MGSGNTQRLRYIQHPSNAEMLGQSLFWCAIEMPRGASRTDDLAALPSKLQKVVRLLSTNSAAWFAYATSFSTRLFTAEVEFDLSRDRGRPVMRLREFNEEGRVTHSELWVRLSNDEWTRCSA